MSVNFVSITIPWVAVPLVLNGHASIFTIPPGGTILSAQEPRKTPDGLLVEFSYDDGKPTPCTMSLGRMPADGEALKDDDMITVNVTTAIYAGG